MAVTLDGVEPAVWRRVRVPADYTLDRLHDVIQIVMGWQDNHLHHFEIGKHRFTELPTELTDADSHEYADESRVRLDEFLPEVLAPFRYEYNPVDEWSLTIAVKRTVRIPMDDPARIALTCLDGGGASPPESVSGLAEYVELLAHIILKPHCAPDLRVV